MFPDQASRSSKLFERACKVMPGGNSRHTVYFPPYPVYAARAEGARVTDVDGVTRLDHQVERWDPVTGSLTAWVRVPVLSDTADVVLHLYLGNPTAVDQQDPVGVWGPDADLVLLD